MGIETESEKANQNKLVEGIAKIVKIVNETCKVGIGVYVGFMDGQGTPIDPAAKYTLLAAPCVLSGAFILSFSSIAQKSMKYAIDTEPSWTEEILSDVPDDKKPEAVEKMKEFAYVVLPQRTYGDAAKSAGITSIKTGAGYAIGYGLARLI
jgi:hypothetical protein